MVRGGGLEKIEMDVVLMKETLGCQRGVQFGSRRALGGDCSFVDVALAFVGDEEICWDARYGLQASKE